MLKKAMPVALLLLAIALVFGQAAFFGFVSWDDTYHLLENPHFQPPMAWNSFSYFWLKPYFGLYIPIVYNVWGLCAKLAFAIGGAGPLSASPFHLLNIACHMCNAYLVLRILRHFTRPLAAFLGALVFALHPLQVEPVVWVSGFKDLLSGFFSLAAINLWFSSDDSPRDRGWAVSWKRAVSLLFFLLAPLAKPGAVMAPFLCMTLSVGRKTRLVTSRRHAFSVIAGTLLLAGVFALVTADLQPSSFMSQPTPVWTRPFVAGDALTFWLGKLFVPWPLYPDYGRPPHVALANPFIWFAWLVPISLVGAAVWWRRRFAVLGVAVAVFFLGCAGNWGIILFGFQNISTVADRYLYMSMVGAALAVAWYLNRIPQRVAVGCGIFFFILAGCGSFCQSRPWRGTEELFRFVLRHNPASFTAANGLAYAMHVKGDIDDALPLYEQAIALNPKFADAHTNLATALYQKGQTERAIEHFKISLDLLPDDGVTLNNLGLALQRQGHLDEAIERYATSIKLTNNPLALHNLGSALELRHDAQGAIRAYQLAVNIVPSMADSWQRLGVLWSASGNDSKAESAFRQTISLDPRRADAWSGLGSVLAHAGRDGEAEDCFAKARALN